MACAVVGYKVGVKQTTAKFMKDLCENSGGQLLEELKDFNLSCNRVFSLFYKERGSYPFLFSGHAKITCPFMRREAVYVNGYKNHSFSLHFRQ